MMITEEIICGIRHVIKFNEINRETNLTSQHYNSHIKHRLEKKVRFEFKDYAPHVFSQIRRLCGIDCASFLESWSLPRKAELQQSAGRSGSIFYKTPDRNYFFKTILHPEVGALMGMLEDYEKHLRDYPRSFIMKVLGLFRFKAELSFTKIWIIIISNVLPDAFLTIDEKYDLKGRDPKPGKSVEERTPTLKDLRKDNEIDRSFYFVNKEDREFYLTQLKADVKFLSAHNIMDYSLLVGVYHLSDEELNYLESQKNEKTPKDIITSSSPKSEDTNTQETGEKKEIEENHSEKDEEIQDENLIEKQETQDEINHAQDTPPDVKKAKEYSSVEVVSHPLEDLGVSEERQVLASITTTTTTKTIETVETLKTPSGVTTIAKKVEVQTTTKTTVPIHIDSNIRKPMIFDTPSALMAGYRGQNPQKSNQQELYFIGIIDCLTLYVLKKRVANVVKRAIWEQAQLSTVNAQYYGTRFEAYMTKTIFPDSSPDKTRGRSSSSQQLATSFSPDPRRQSAPQHDQPLSETM